MESSNNPSKENESAKPNPILDNLKGDYFLQKLYDNIQKKKKLEIVKYNKRIQNRLNLCIKDYKEYSEAFIPIEIEIIPAKGKYGEFINVNENDKLFYHIYFNDDKEEIKNKYTIKKKDKVTKIKIIIDYQVKSFQKLFFNCYCIESINFKKFYRNNIIDMSHMFFCCSSLKELNLTNFNTDNVTNMSYMFCGCRSLNELNLTNFNTNNVTDMRWMFVGCSGDLKWKIKSEYKNTKNIKDDAFY
jgi:surface protein